MSRDRATHEGYRFCCVKRCGGRLVGVSNERYWSESSVQGQSWDQPIKPGAQAISSHFYLLQQIINFTFILFSPYLPTVLHMQYSSHSYLLQQFDCLQFIRSIFSYCTLHIQYRLAFHWATTLFSTWLDFSQTFRNLNSWAIPLRGLFLSRFHLIYVL